MGAAGEDAAVDFRVQRLDAAIHHFGKAGHVADVDHRQAGIGQRFRGSAGRDQLEAPRKERFPKRNQAGFIGNTQNRTPHRATSSLNRKKIENPTLWIKFSELTPNVTAQYHPRSPFLRTRRPQVAAFFCCPQLIQRCVGGSSVRWLRAASKTGRERCVSQARSSGSTTPRATVLSSAKAAATCSCTTRRFRAPVSALLKRDSRLSSKSLTVLKVRRPAT